MEDRDVTGYRSLTEITTFYHVSPRLLAPGTLLTPQHKKNFGGCSGNYVYLSNAPAPHYTVEQIAREDHWLVYQVEPVGSVGLGTCYDLICQAATVIKCVGTVARFPGTSKVVIRPFAAPVQSAKTVSAKRLELVERVLGATVSVVRGEVRHTGQIVFADYESFCVLVRGERVDVFAPLNEVKLLSLRTEAVGVVHGVRLNSWRYGSGWEGCELNRLDHAETVLESLAVPKAA